MLEIPIEVDHDMWNFVWKRKYQEPPLPLLGILFQTLADHTVIKADNLAANCEPTV
jgi:hypothetical protein